MRKRAGVIVAALFYYSGLLALARWWTRRRDDRLLILNYHRARGGDLRRHLLYLRRHYRMVHLEDALGELYAAREEGERERDRRTRLVLTFDDGYRDNFTCAYALARELRVPITIFLVPGYIESGRPFWWLEGRRLAFLTRVEKAVVEGRVYPLEQPGERERLAWAIDEQLRRAPSVAGREELLAHLYQALAVAPDAEVDGEARPLTWDEIGEMVRSGWVSFGAHTMHHPVLAYLADPQEVGREVSECRAVLEQHLGHPVRTFAYPIGRLEHIGEQTLRAVRDAGYSWAVTTLNGASTPRSDPLLLQRLLGDVSRHRLVMAAEVSGIWRFFSPLWKNALFGSGEQ